MSSIHFKFIYLLNQKPLGQSHEEHKEIKINNWKQNKQENIKKKQVRKEIQYKVYKRGHYNLEDNTWPFSG